MMAAGETGKQRLKAMVVLRIDERHVNIDFGKGLARPPMSLGRSAPFCASRRMSG
jgi:hypothetical protein